VATGACSGSSGGRVTILYDQAANFSSYRVNVGDPPVMAQGAIFVMYRITKISNSAGIPFTFDKHSVLVGAKGKTRNEEPADDAQLLGDRMVNGLQVASGKTAKDPGCIIKLADAPDPAKVADALIPASYVQIKMDRALDDNVTAPVSVATSISLKNICRA